MKNNMISRRGFLRKAVGTAAAATVAGMAAGCSAASQAPASSSEAARGTYIPGTYSATANGMSTVTVTMTRMFSGVRLPTLVSSSSSTSGSY